MKKATSVLPGILTHPGMRLLDTRLVEQVADLMQNTAFFIKDASGRYVVLNQSLVERHGLKEKSQMLGRRPCDVSPGDYGRIPTSRMSRCCAPGGPSSSGWSCFGAGPMCWCGA